MQRLSSTILMTVIATGTLILPSAAQSLTKIGSYATGNYNIDGGNAEISAYDPVSKHLFFVSGSQNSFSILDLSNPSSPAFLGTTTVPGREFNSVSVYNGVVAFALQGAVKTDSGSVEFYNAATGAFLTSQTVGSLPDMVTFSPNGSKLLVANEGEPNSYGQVGSVDPVGSVSILSVSYPSHGQVTVNSNTTAGFTSFNGQEAALRAQGVRIFGPGASAAQDFEPEYITFSPDSQKAYVTLQENNAMAIVDLNTGLISDVKALGFKDFSLPGNELDASDRDSATNTASIHIVKQPVFGMYQPDGVSTFQANGQTYLIMANEGDSRAYTGGNEETTVAGVALDHTAFPNFATLQGNGPDGIGRLAITNALGDIDGDGDFDKLYAFGGRSFSIRDLNGNLLWDSGSSIELLTAGLFPANFNASHVNNTLDSRSTKKGPEPENVTVGQAFGLTLGFVGMERIGGVLMYDLSNPLSPGFLSYTNSRNFSQTPGTDSGGDLGPEGLLFISAANSPNGQPLLIVSNEISGSIAVFQVNSVPEPATALMGCALLGLCGLARRRNGR